ncbi:L-aspartate oxidase [Salinithrix halophila]|uniref:L-aspartate oxidase n=1 Tax=Salinithrix halophila TaxID=1485204 RepID=A0ABV8JDY3_9BACL
MKRIETDFVVVGSGIAGLMTALTLAENGEVTVLTKSRAEAGNSSRAQGGIAAAVGEGDSPSLHREDTLRTGVGLCRRESVDVLVEGGPEAVDRLAQLGTPFDRGEKGWTLGREGSHSVNRILHAAGDATGAAIMGPLLRRIKEHPRIRLVTHTQAVDLVVEDGECLGVLAAGTKGAVLHLARAVVLATGGCGQIYRYTTNDPAVTGDGLAMAWRAGAALADMEFIQFHPTALAVEANPMFLISEAVRGEGALLVNERGEAFMARYHEWRDLAPRDVVSRAIDREMREGRRVFLNATSLGEGFAKRFPTIYRRCREAGIDPACDWIPVTPAAHFVMGGVWTDTYGRTSLSRLFAVGETACTGVHGANRLASNSLLEGAVYARRVAKDAASLPELVRSPSSSRFPALSTDPCNDAAWKEEVRRIMWEHAGIIRNEQGLAHGLRALSALARKIPEPFVECHNMIAVSQMVMESALWRRESRGGHYRSDCPETLVEWENRRRMAQRGRQDEPVMASGYHT